MIHFVENLKHTLEYSLLINTEVLVLSRYLKIFNNNDVKICMAFWAGFLILILILPQVRDNLVQQFFFFEPSEMYFPTK